MILGKEAVDKYFQRLGLDPGDFKEPNYENLVKLNMANQLSVPFENLDTFLGVKTILTM